MISFESMVLALILIIFLAAYAVLIFFYLVTWKKAKNYTAAAADADVFVSVVIAARNEETTLPLLLRDLEQQNYPLEKFEVIVVNDFSSDGTSAVRPERLPNFSMIVPEGSSETSSKKKAIAAGITAARGELMLITDADCRVPPQWIATMVSYYRQTGAAFIAAPVKFESRNTLLSVFQSLDFLVLQGITAASVSSGFHNMCNGANLAYTKEAFLAVNGFEGIDSKASGDDMLLMHKVAQRYPERIHYLKSKQALVSTEPVPDWKSFLAQRKRWASKTMVYQDRRILLVLAFVLLFNILFFVLFFTAFFDADYWWLVLMFFVGKTLVELPFVVSLAGFFEMQKLVPWFIVLQPLHIFYTAFVGIVSQFGKYEWKGRKVR